jgi:hypothetical protein
VGAMPGREAAVVAVLEPFVGRFGKRPGGGFALTHAPQRQAQLLFLPKIWSARSATCRYLTISRAGDAARDVRFSVRFPVQFELAG